MHMPVILVLSDWEWGRTGSVYVLSHWESGAHPGNVS